MGIGLITPGRDGVAGLTLDKTIAKKKRGKILFQAAHVGAEKNKGLENWQPYKPSDPANAILWPSDPSKMAPRGSANSWSFAVPAKKQKSGGWLPLEDPGKEDRDFKEQPVEQLPFDWYGGELPGNVSAAVLSTTSHPNPQLVAFPPGGPIVAHHLGNNPPKRSRFIWDIKGDDIDPDRGAGHHSFVRVRRMPRAFCGGGGGGNDRTTSSDFGKPQSDKLNAVMLNGTKSTGDHTGWLSMHFKDADAAGSHEVFGFMRAGPPNRLLGKTEDGDYRAAAIDWDRHLFSDGTNANTGPLDLKRTQWEEGSKGLIIKLVEARIDRKELVNFLCGPRPGKIKFQTWDDWKPPSPITKEPVPKKPKYPRQEPEPTSPLFLPYEGPDPGKQGDPASTSPNEIAIPSEYGAAMPGQPDGSDRKRHETVARSENEKAWLNQVGMTEAEFFAGLHYVTHDVFVAKTVNTTAVAAESPNDRWPIDASQKPEIRVDQSTGRVLQSKPGFAPGARVILAGNVPREYATIDRIGDVPNDPDEHTVIIAAGATSGPTEVHKGRIGLGQAIKGSARLASGWELKLRYDGAGGITNPDLDLVAKNASGAESAGGAVVKINGTAITAGGSGDVVGPAGATDDAVATFNTTTGKLIQDSGVTIVSQEIAGLDAIRMNELSSPPPVPTGEGQFWVEDTEPTAPRFTDDDGTDHDIMLGDGNLEELTDYDTALANLGGATTVVPSLTDEALTDGGAAELRDVAALGALVFEARLSPSSSVPVATANVTTVSTLYLQPYKGNRVALYNTTDSCWEIHHMSGAVSKALSSLTSGRPYDVFLYDNSGTLTLEFVAWSSGTLRSTALTTQNGAYVKSGDASRRYVGTFYTTASNATTWIVDGGSSASVKLFIWNYYNRVDVAGRVEESTTSWTYGSSTKRYMNNDSTNRVECVIGVQEDAIAVDVSVGARTWNTRANIGIGEDSSTTTTGFTTMGYAQNNHYRTLHVALKKQPAIGYHYYAAVEWSTFGTTGFHGTDGSVGQVSGTTLTGRF